MTPKELEEKIGFKVGEREELTRVMGTIVIRSVVTMTSEDAAKPERMAEAKRQVARCILHEIYGDRPDGVATLLMKLKVLNPFSAEWHEQADKLVRAFKPYD